MIKLALFGSGNGTNIQQITEYFINNEDIIVELIIVNKKDAYARDRARRLGVDNIYYGRDSFYNSNMVLEELEKRGIDYIILAGFLWLIPENLLRVYSNRIINIHPALLPKYGGKGMYGDNVHRAVIENKEIESGITIHYVNEDYDKGQIIFQAKCKILPNDSADDLAGKIHLLEKEYYPKVIESVIKSKLP